MTSLPLSFTNFARQARSSLEKALADGQKRLVLDVQTFRKTSPAVLKPLLGELPTPWVGVFGTGNAGLGTLEWGEGKWSLLDSGEAFDYLDRLSWQMLVLMDASAIENQPMQRFWRIAGDKPLLMVNCWPEAPGVVGLGRGPEKERQRLRDQLTLAYYLQAYRFQPLVIHRAYPDPWQLWRTDTPEPTLVSEQPEPFTPKQLQTLTQKLPQVNVTERFNAFWLGPKYFRDWD
jgi:Domain of unknown function (DUF1995)